MDIEDFMRTLYSKQMVSDMLQNAYLIACSTLKADLGRYITEHINDEHGQTLFDLYIQATQLRKNSNDILSMMPSFMKLISGNNTFESSEQDVNLDETLSLLPIRYETQITNETFESICSRSRIVSEYVTDVTLYPAKRFTLYELEDATHHEHEQSHYLLTIQTRTDHVLYVPLHFQTDKFILQQPIYRNEDGTLSSDVLVKLSVDPQVMMSLYDVDISYPGNLITIDETIKSIQEVFTCLFVHHIKDFAAVRYHMFTKHLSNQSHNTYYTLFTTITFICTYQSNLPKSVYSSIYVILTMTASGDYEPELLNILAPQIEVLRKQLLTSI